MPKISEYLNRTVLVSIPALFEDGKCREYTLAGEELRGLWLESDELARRLLPDNLETYASTEPVVFVPFAQIAGILVARKVPAAQQQPTDDEKSSAGAAESLRQKRQSATPKAD